MPRYRLEQHMQKNGYHTETAQLCFGVAHIAASSLIAGKINDHDARSRLFANFAPAELHQQIKNAEQKQRDKTPLNDDELSYVEIPTYFQAVQLANRAYQYPVFIPLAPKSQDAESVLKLVSSVDITKLPNSFSGIYLLADLTVYCQTLREQLALCEEPIALTLISGSHAVTLGYDHAKNEWLLIDDRQPLTQRFSNNEDVAQAIISSFSTNGVATFSTTVYSKIEDEHLKAAVAMQQTWLNQAQMMYIQSTHKERARWMDSRGATWLYVAAQSGDMINANKLLANGAVVDACYLDNTTPVFVSIQNGHTALSALLEEAGADLELKNDQGVTATQLKLNHGVYHHIGYNTDEHEAIARAAEIRDIHGQPLTKLTIFTLDDQLQPMGAGSEAISFTDLVAMPDYFGLTTGSISDYLAIPEQTTEQKIARFIAAYNKLASTENLARQVAKIDHIAEEHDDEVTDTIKEVACCGMSYLSLLEQNYDHFAPDAYSTYEIGHQIALTLAKKARELRETDPQLAEEYLEIAYAIAAFALHFATDNFSAGHLRTPRRKLVELFGKEIGGALANSMHDEDNLHGIVAQNASGEQWEMFGDGNLELVGNQMNKEKVMRMVQQSVAEIYNCFETGVAPQPEAFIARKLTPKATDDLYVDDLTKPFQRNEGYKGRPQNPLFYEQEGKIFVRKDLKSRECGEYEALHEPHAVIDEAKLRVASIKSAHEDKPQPTKPEVSKPIVAAVVEQPAPTIAKASARNSEQASDMESISEEQNSLKTYVSPQVSVEDASSAEILQAFQATYEKNKALEQCKIRMTAVALQYKRTSETLGHRFSFQRGADDSFKVAKILYHLLAKATVEQMPQIVHTFILEHESATSLVNELIPSVQELCDKISSSANRQSITWNRETILAYFARSEFTTQDIDESAFEEANVRERGCVIC